MEKKETLCEIIGIILGDGYIRFATTILGLRD